MPNTPRGLPTEAGDTHRSSHPSTLTRRPSADEEVPIARMVSQAAGVGAGSPSSPEEAAAGWWPRRRADSDGAPDSPLWAVRESTLLSKSLTGAGVALLACALVLAGYYGARSGGSTYAPPGSLVQQWWEAFPPPPPSDRTPWSYVEGPLGPSQWSDIRGPDGSALYPLCSSLRQSPVDIRSSATVPMAATAPDRRTFATSYDIGPTPQGHTGFALTPTGHIPETWLVTSAAGSADGVIGSVNFTFIDLHMHGPSDHTIDGVRYPVEAHLVYENDASDTRVLAILFALAEEPNPFLMPFMPYIAAHRRRPLPTQLNMEGLINDIAGTIYTYDGSLTVPPCTHATMQVTVSRFGISPSQVLLFKWLQQGDNQRPAQALGTRKVLSRPVI